MTAVAIPGRVTVVITNYNRCADLRDALVSVERQNYADVEIIVVDNASQDDSCRMLADEFPRVAVIPLPENIGMDGYSEGFGRARGEFIFQMDNDSLMPDDNVLSEVVRCFRTGPSNLAAVATRVENWRRNETIDELRQRCDARGPFNTGGFHSGGVGFRHAFLDQVGYYNRDVFLYGSEIFLQMKFLAAGYQICYYPEIMVLHKASVVARSSRSVYYELRNRYWFMRCFATPSQQLRYLPEMLLHDFVYAIYKRALNVFWRALGDGFGSMPTSLQPVLRSTNPEFLAQVNYVGKQFGFGCLVERTLSRLSGKTTGGFAENNPRNL